MDTKVTTHQTISSTLEPLSTSNIAVRFFAAAKAAVGTDRASWQTIPGDTIDSVIHRSGFGDDPIFDRCSFLLDGKVEDRNAPIDLASGLDVLPPFAGG